MRESDLDYFCWGPRFAVHFQIVGRGKEFLNLFKLAGA